VLNAPPHQGGARGVAAAHLHSALVGLHRLPASRTLRRKFERRRFRRPPGEVHAHDGRDDVAGLLHVDRVADPQVASRNLLPVMQGGPRHGRPAEPHRRELRHRSEHASAAHLQRDGEQLCLDALGRELEGHRPARRRLARAQSPPAAARASTFTTAPSTANGSTLRARPQAATARTSSSAPRAGQLASIAGRPHSRKRRARSRCVAGRARRGSQAPTPKHTNRSPRSATAAPSACRRVPAASWRGCANGGSPVCCARRVDPREVGPRHIDLTAHLDDRGAHLARQFAGHPLDPGHIRRHVLTFATVAAGQRPHQPASLVREAHRQPVVLGLHHQRHLLLPRQSAPRGPRKLRSSASRCTLSRLSIGSRCGRLGPRPVRSSPKAGSGGADGRGRRVRPLQRRQSPPQRIVRRVGNLRPRLAMVERVVPRDLPAQFARSRGRPPAPPRPPGRKGPPTTPPAQSHVFMPGLRWPAILHRPPAPEPPEKRVNATRGTRPADPRTGRAPRM
jgi:hypothetical protein